MLVHCYGWRLDYDRLAGLARISRIGRSALAPESGEHGGRRDDCHAGGERLGARPRRHLAAVEVLATLAQLALVAPGGALLAAA